LEKQTNEEERVMKKMVLFCLTAAALILLSADLSAQTTYWTESFKDSTIFPANGKTTAPAEAVTANGTWIFYYSYRTTSVSSGNPADWADIRMVKTSSVTDAGNGPYCYMTTPVVDNGVGTISFWEIRGGRYITIETSTDGGTTWTVFGNDTTAKGAYNSTVINDSKANRVRISIRSGSDADIDAFSITSYPGSGVADQAATPAAFTLHQNYPNPFNPSTAIRYELAEAARVAVAVYNAHGQRMALLVDSRQSAGTHEVVWNGAADGGSILPSGMYFCRIDAPGFSKTMKMVLMK
jgi:hypothetical protein